MGFQENFTTSVLNEADKRMSAYLLSVAVFSLFPKAELLQEQVDEIGFSFSFVFPFEFSSEFFPLIEERMRQIAKSKEPLYVKEMVLSCAKQYFIDKKQIHLLSKISEEMKTVEFFEHGNLIFLCNGGVKESFDDLDHVKLYDFHVMKNGVVEVFGLVAEDKFKLKELFKQVKQGKKHSHLAVGSASDIFSVIDERFFWHPKGVQFKEKIIDLLVKERQAFGFEWIETPNNVDPAINHKKFFLQNKKHPPYRCFEIQKVILEDSVFHPSKGLFITGEYTKEVASVFCRREEIEKECISSLHFIQKISTILDLYGDYVLLSPYRDNAKILKKALEEAKIDYKIQKTDALKQSRIVLQLKDCYGRLWNGPFIELIMVSDELCQIKFSIFPSLERIVGLMIERTNLNERELIEDK